ncbi:hypothetical protein M23134_02254 [Microscilla marina ATCC 23134]|uniref:Uncharacterized protein n=1 Tax=Microscilla marina ATCC 23134 TaxID=313606 RepID=A1ZK37_MICM2|nr:hypothetical protein M23134_02254 [Microscilla marina ATCC 23134]
MQTTPHHTAQIKQQIRQMKQDTTLYAEVNTAIERLLPSGITQLHYVVFTQQHQVYQLSILAQKIQIIGIKLFKVTYNKGYTYPREQLRTLYSWVNTASLQKYIDGHNLLYGSQLTTGDISLLPFRLYKYGSDCGHSTPDQYRRMRQLIRQKDEYTLQKWLRSMNIELQAYALEGLARLKHPEKIKRSRLVEIHPQVKLQKRLSKKYLWRVSEAKVVQLLNQSTAKVYTCAGCFGMNYTPIATLVEKMGF